MKGFTILGHARVGSTWLLRLLNSHPQINMLGEVLHGTGTGKFVEGKHWPVNESNVYDYLNKYYNKEGVNGIKIFFRHINRWGIDKYFADNNVKVISLERNLLDCFVSYKHAEKTSVWGYTEKNKNKRIDYNKHSISIDAKELLKYLNFNTDKRAKYNSLYSNNMIIVRYEDLLHNMKEVMANVLQYLEVDVDVGMHADTLQSSNVYKPLDKITNSDEVVEMLTDTKFEYMLQIN